MRLQIIPIVCFILSIWTVFASPIYDKSYRSLASLSPRAGRSPSTVSQAWCKKGPAIGSGGFGTVYDLPNGYNARPAAVKKIDLNSRYKNVPAKQRAEAIKGTVMNEVGNLKAVNQLLAWGVKHGRQGDAYYIVMSKMGGAPPASMSPAEKQKLQRDAQQRYERFFRVQHEDIRDQNFVYRQVKGKWQAELIDWGTARYLSGTKRPAVPPPEKMRSLCI